MEFANKFLLTPAGRPDPSLSKMSELDKEMSKILKDPKKSTFEKMKLYFQTLKRNIDIETNMRNNEKVPESGPYKNLLHDVNEYSYIFDKTNVTDASPEKKYKIAYDIESEYEAENEDGYDEDRYDEYDEDNKNLTKSIIKDSFSPNINQLSKSVTFGKSELPLTPKFDQTEHVTKMKRQRTTRERNKELNKTINLNNVLINPNDWKGYAQTLTRSIKNKTK
jgi:hypothetical protein